ncbi:MAG: T9SS type A sorting domain-containing protein, partial [Bacteroidota bacterium]
ICNGEAYTFGSSTFTSSGTYQNTLTSSNGCDSIVTLNLSVQASVTENLMIAICEGSSYTVGNNTYTTSGTYQNTLIASSGCDSIVTLNLSVQPSITENLTIAICEGSSYTVGNNTYTTSGTYQNTLMASSGCDSVVTLNLSVQPSITEDLTVEICEGSSYTVGNNTYTTSGTYQNTLMASSGCDSIVTLNLSVQPSITENLTIAICEGSSYSVGNNTYTTSGTYQNTLTSLSGCDSIVMLNLSVQPSITENLTIAICEGSSYTVGNNTYTASGTYQNTLMASSGCDSIVTLNLSVQPTITENLTAEICEGETYTILGNSYNTSGVYEDTLTTASGCDIIINLDLTVFSIPTEERTIEICEGETYSVAGNTYDSSGTYENILTDSNGCDSIVILNLTVHPTFTENLSVDICEGEVLLIGDGYDETGIYEITFTASNGCDSVVILDLFVQPAITENLSIDICEGETYSIGGNTYDESGTYENTLVGTNGCNILVILDLIIHPITNENIYEEICEGDFYSFGNQTLTEAGDYQATFITQNNCDSIVNLELQVLPNEEITIDEAINYGDTFNGVVYFSDTTLVEIYAAQNGCDSIVTINLSILTNTDELHNERMSLKVYPIPTYENVLLNYILKENAYLQFRLYNTSGQLLSYIAKSQLAGEHTDTLDLEYLPQGVYWLSVQIDQQTMVKKIVKIAY